MHRGALDLAAGLRTDHTMVAHAQRATADPDELDRIRAAGVEVVVVPA